MQILHSQNRGLILRFNFHFQSLISRVSFLKSNFLKFLFWDVFFLNNSQLPELIFKIQDFNLIFEATISSEFNFQPQKFHYLHSFV